MNGGINLCTQHQQPCVFKCKFARCYNFLGCQICFSQGNEHFEHQKQPIPQNMNQQGFPQSPQNNPIHQALNSFDNQFDSQFLIIKSQIDSFKQQMKQQFTLFLQAQNPDIISQYSIGTKIDPIHHFFNTIQSCVSQFGQNDPINSNSNKELDFDKYYENYKFPDYIKKQLDLFKFDSQEFENQSIECLTEEDRKDSLMIGQKDNSTGLFNGRVMIIYKAIPAAIYLGYMKNNMRHGKGILVIDDYQYYHGQFYNNLEWGYGEMKIIINNQERETYQGYFSEGKKCGSGSLTTSGINQSGASTSCIEYFNNILHGPKCDSNSKFDLLQYGQSYFEINIKNGKALKELIASSKQIIESNDKTSSSHSSGFLNCNSGGQFPSIHNSQNQSLIPGFNPNNLNLTQPQGQPQGYFYGNNNNNNNNFNVQKSYIKDVFFNNDNI